MARRNHGHGFDKLEPRKLELLRDTFEEFARQLLDHELNERFPPGPDGFELQGPPPYAVQGLDLRVRVHLPPRTTRDAFQKEKVASPLTFDEIGLWTVYSVKSGRHWWGDAKKEAEKTSDWAVDALAAGGRLVLILAHTKEGRAKTSKKGKGSSERTPKEPRRELASLYWSRLRKTDSLAPDPLERIAILDQNDLAAYLRAVRPAVAKPLLEALGVFSFSRLHDLDAWYAHHKGERDAPPYQADAHRAGRASEIVAQLTIEPIDKGSRAVWLVSPPGIGKTRLVYEALHAREELARRTYVAVGASEADGTLEPLFEQLGDPILVVDDCPVSEVERLHRRFVAANGSKRGALLVITAVAADQVGREAPPRLRVLPLERLGAEAAKKLIASQAVLNQEEIDAVERVTEGYPWFLVLLAKEVGTGEPPKDLGGAVDRVLCSRNELGTDVAVEVPRRAAALMIVILLEGEDHEGLTQEDRATLCEIFRFENWVEFQRVVEACARRGLVRVGPDGSWRYVTPEIIEREIVQRFLPGGPGEGARSRHEVPLSTRNRDRLTERIRRLLGRLEGLAVPEETLAILATPIVMRLASESGGIEALRRAGATTTELLFAAHHQPSPTARVLRALVEATPLDALRADRPLRGPLVYALQSLGGRRAGFDDAEAALFRLALAENEGLENSATKVWAALFDLELNWTYRTFEDKRAILEGRLNDALPESRLVALGALERMILAHNWKLAGERLDGPYAKEPPSSAHEARCIAWDHILEHVTDADPRVAARSVALVVAHLRDSLFMGVAAHVFARLTPILRAFTETDLRALREVLDLSKAHDRERIERNGAICAWEALLQAAAPRSYRERFRQQVGARFIPFEEAEQADRNLAAEGLAPPCPLLDEIDWLATDAGLRYHVFCRALGAVDANETVLPLLLERAAAAPDRLACYLSGVALERRDDVARRAILWLRERGLTVAVAGAIWRLPAQRERVAWFLEDLKQGRVPESLLHYFDLAGWENGVNQDQFDETVEALLERGSVAAAGVALGWLWSRTKRSPELLSQRRGPLERALSRVAGEEVTPQFLSYIWAQAAQVLVRSGGAAFVSNLVIERIAASEDLPWSVFEEVLRACAMADPIVTWASIRSALEREDDAEGVAMTLGYYGIAALLPTSEVMAWVSRDRRRAERVARMISMHEGPAIAELARLLLSRFGAGSAVGPILLGALHTTPVVVGSMAAFLGREMERVQPWLDDADPEVRAFARRATAELEEGRSQYANREEYARRRFGT